MTQSSNNKFLNKNIILPSLQFRDINRENSYLKGRFQSDKRLVQWLIFIVSITLLAILFSDHLIIQSQYWPNVTISWRGGFVTLSVVFIFYLNKVTFPNTLRKLGLIYIVILMTNLLLMDLTFKKDYVLFVFFDVIIIIAIYFSTILSFSTSLILCLSFGLSGSILVWQFKEVSSHSLIMVCMAYFAANIAGIILSIQQHISKRTLFKKNLKLKELTEQLYKQAYFDPLTNVKNRRTFDKDFESHLSNVLRCQQESKDVYLIAADIDYFKQINDKYGHATGDQVLMMFCKRINSLIRPTDDIYRFGGEEFIIIIHEVTQQEAEAKVQSFITSLNDERFNINNQYLSVSSSFGITQIGEKEDKDLVVARADSALYEAKEKGRNRFVVAHNE
mgnify:CR=1 FL=1